MSKFPWLESYPDFVSHSTEINYENIIEIYDQSIRNFGDKVAYKNMDVEISFNDVNKHVDALVWYFQNKTNLKKNIEKILDQNKAQSITAINLKKKSYIADYMIIASGTSSRHIQSLSEQVLEKLKDNGIKNSKIEGKESNEWKLVDGIDLIVHIFHPEKRKFYELEKIWSELIPKEKVII